MKIPDNAIVDAEQLTGYLLLPRPRNDKSKFLLQGGFTPAHATALEQAIREAAAQASATEDGYNAYGIFYRQDTALAGLNGVRLPVALIWIRLFADQQVRFVTLKPRSETRHGD